MYDGQRRGVKAPRDQSKDHGLRPFPMPSRIESSLPAGEIAFILYFHYYRIMEETAVVKALAALAQPVRLKIFRALVVAGQEGMTPTRLTELLETPAATLSFHLKELLNAGLVTQERDGRSLIYRAAYDQMNALLSFMTMNCCQGQPQPAQSAAGCEC
jgi:DNA-binding transcriptional ArsR family regulator